MYTWSKFKNGHVFFSVSAGMFIISFLFPTIPSTECKRNKLLIASYFFPFSFSLCISILFWWSYKNSWFVAGWAWFSFVWIHCVHRRNCCKGLQVCSSKYPTFFWWVNALNYHHIIYLFLIFQFRLISKIYMVTIIYHLRIKLVSLFLLF